MIGHRLDRRFLAASSSDGCYLKLASRLANRATQCSDNVTSTERYISGDALHFPSFFLSVRYSPTVAKFESDASNTSYWLFRHTKYQSILSHTTKEDADVDGGNRVPVVARTVGRILEASGPPVSPEGDAGGVSMRRPPFRPVRGIPGGRTSV